MTPPRPSPFPGNNNEEDIKLKASTLMLTQACQRCWRRKQKCDRISPECSTCVAAGVRCQPRVWGRVLDSDDLDETGQSTAAIHTSPIEYLKQRIRYLENEAAAKASPRPTRARCTAAAVASIEHESPTATGSINAQSPTARMPGLGSARSAPPPRANTTTMTPNANTQQAYNTNADTNPTPGSDVNVPDRVAADVAVNEVEYLSLTAMSGRGKNDQNALQSSILNYVMKTIAYIRGTDPSSVSGERVYDGVHSTDHEANTAAFAAIEEEFKSSAGRDHRYFVRIFIRCLAWYFPFLTELECSSLVDRVMHPGTQQHMSRSKAEDEEVTMAVDISKISSVIALGAIMSPQYNTVRGPIQRLVELSKQSLPMILTSATDTDAILCLILQTYLSLHNPSAGSAWHLLGLALTKAVSAGLHRSPDSVDVNDNDGEEEELRRSKAETLFWILYLLDRTLAATLGRPFGIEDDDITLKTPETFLPSTQQTEMAILSKIHFARKVHLALLQSQWRRGDPKTGHLSLDVSIASYEYWKTSYLEVCKRCKTEIENEHQNHRDNMMTEGLAESSNVRRFLQKEEAQYSCRALVHLLDQALRRVALDDPSLIRLRKHVTSELPRIIDVIHTDVDGEHGTLSFLDAYDAFAAAIAYIVCLYDPQDLQQQRQHSSFRLGITQMRTLTMTIDVIQCVSDQFRPIRGFRDVLWAFLQTLEARAEGNMAANRLPDVIATCEASIPHYVRRLIAARLQM